MSPIGLRYISTTSKAMYIYIYIYIYISGAILPKLFWLNVKMTCHDDSATLECFPHIGSLWRESTGDHKGNVERWYFLFYWPEQSVEQTVKLSTIWYPMMRTVYPKKYAHGFVVFCFVVVMKSFIMISHEVFIHIHQGYFAGTGAIVRLPQCQCQWSKPDGYGKISQCITTTKHSKAKTVCIYVLGYTVCDVTVMVWVYNERMTNKRNEYVRLLFISFPDYMDNVYRPDDMVIITHIPEVPHLPTFSLKRKLFCFRFSNVIHKEICIVVRRSRRTKVPSGAESQWCG